MQRIRPGWSGASSGSPSQEESAPAELVARAVDPDRFDHIAGLAQAGGVDQHERNPADRQRNLDDVAGGARDLGDDGSLSTLR